MPLKVYDGDTSTYISTNKGVYYRMKIESSMIGSIIKISVSGSANGFSFRDVNLNIIGKEVKSPSTLTIPEGAEWIYYRLTADLVARFYEITPVIE